MAFAPPTVVAPRAAPLSTGATPLSSRPAHAAPPPRAPAPQRRIAPRMVEQNTIVAVTTMLAGLGAGLGLVAWTENQGERTTQRENLQACFECKGDTTTVCNVCNGSKEDPLDASKTCTYCDGVGVIKCFNCAGSGLQPRYLDRLSPEDFMD